MWWPKTARQHELVTLAGELADRFAVRAPQHDIDGTFPHENFADLHESGYLALTIPAEFGGGGASIIEMVLAQERLARGDASTALGAAMHLSILGRLGQAVLETNAPDTGETSGWDRARYAAVAKAVIDEGALINSAASEPETGSPSRGGRPSTTAVLVDAGTAAGSSAGTGGGESFVITGRKTFTTMAPGLRFFMVSATITGRGRAAPAAGQFLLEAGAPGLRIERTWDSVGMRASGSDDLVLEGVRVPPSALLSCHPYAPAAAPDSRGTPGTSSVSPALLNVVEPSSLPAAYSSASPAPRSEAATAAPRSAPSAGAGWAALIPAVYLGVAVAARNAAVDFARRRKPQPLGGASIGELPAVQRLLGEIEVALVTARALLFGTAEAWLEAPHRRAELVPVLAAAKYVVTNGAVEITDKAMRVVGGAGLARSHPIQRYYRDVRAGLHHPPMDDVALTMLARAALAGV